MKMRLIKLTPECLMERLQGKPTSLPANLPSDVELMDIKFDMFSGQVLAVVRSDSFEDVADAYPIPEFNLTYSATPKTETNTPSAVVPAPKAEMKPAAQPSTPKPVVTKQVSSKKDTGLMEEEFTDEQRKLLSFSVDGEFVVVKPIKFLKAEWDDINDTVRSLGGRWVKGDIISYWEIPLR
ncbi:MAG: hypothetical protein NWF05_04735 [Candidatus Bathyarchaeota archaeon]|nr:hypothetical protein [Candidatus Bathyarchaeota archaeon]